MAWPPGWYVATRASSLGTGPISRTVCGVPLVLFRSGSGAPTALLDRCPHRSVPLSRGRCESGTLRCAYHGWRFDAHGRCLEVPGLLDSPIVPAYHAACRPTQQRNEWIWVYMARDDETPPPLPELPRLALSGATHVTEVVDAPASLLATLENALDVPHTAFLHRGLFRGSGQRQRLRAVLTRDAGGAQVQYHGERRPAGLAGRILAPSGGEVVHRDRFLLPSIAQVEYAIGSETRFLVTAACTPIHAARTRIHATLSFRTRVPGWLVRTLLRPIGLRIFRQDATILDLQQRAQRRFAGAPQASSPLDLMGAQIARLMAQARAGNHPPREHPPYRREIELFV